MLDFLKKAAYFLHIVDDDGQFDLTDMAFIAIIVKIMVAPQLDFPAVVTLATVMVNKMHRRQIDNNITDASEQVKQMAQQIQNLQAQIAPVIDKIKGAVSGN